MTKRLGGILEVLCLDISLYVFHEANSEGGGTMRWTGIRLVGMPTFIATATTATVLLGFRLSGSFLSPVLTPEDRESTKDTMPPIPQVRYDLFDHTTTPPLEGHSPRYLFHAVIFYFMCNARNHRRSKAESDGVRCYVHNPSE